MLWIIVFLLLGVSIGRLLIRINLFDKDLVFYVGVAIAPIAMSTWLFFALELFPHQPPWFYLCFVLGSVGAFVYLILRKNSSTKVARKTIQRKNDWRVLNIFLSLMIALVTAFSLLILLKFPVSWSDQISYILKGYASANDTSVSSYYNPSFELEDSQIFYNNDIMVRPGLPLIYTLFYWTTNGDLSSIDMQTRLLTIYYLLVLVVLLYKVSEKKWGKTAGLLAVFFQFTCFYFLKFALQGYKDLIIMAMTLATAILIFDGKNLRSSGWVKSLVFGVFLGLMSMVNYSGIAIAVLLMITYFLTTTNKLVGVKKLAMSGLTMLTVAHGEILYFAKWVINGVQSSLVELKTPVVMNNILNSNVGASNELRGYGLTSTIDTFLRGKLQAFTLIHYFGLVYWLGLLIIIFRFRHLLKDILLKNLLLFVGLFYFVIIDPLYLNKHPQAYVLSISPKYTLLLLPFVAILLASQSEWWLNQIEKINQRFFWLGSFAGLGGLYIMVKYQSSVMFIIFKFLIGKFLPINQGAEYYQQKFILLISLAYGGWLVVYFLNILLRHRIHRDLVVSLLLFWVVCLPFASSLNTEYKIKLLPKVIAKNEIARLESLNKSNAAFFPVVEYFTKNDNAGTILASSGYRKLTYYLHGYGYIAKQLAGSWKINMVCKSADTQYFVIQRSDPSYVQAVHNSGIFEVVYQNTNYTILECINKKNIKNKYD